MRTAVCLFPGQGSQHVGMGRDLAAEFAVARRAFEEAEACLEAPLTRLCFEGPQETLQLTEHAQPAVLTASIAAFRVLRETTGFAPLALAGHSLGEWSALVVAGALAFTDALRGVRERGRLMQAAVRVGEGAMVALRGLESEEVSRLCAEVARADVLVPANLNGGGQVVVSGHAAAVERLVTLAAERKIRTRQLAVSAPFHCSLMAPAAEGLARFLDGVALRPPVLPVWTSVDARPVRDAADARELLTRQVTAPVRWEETVRGLASLGPAVAFEVGPGRALSTLLRRTVRDLQSVPIGDLEGMARAREVLT